MLCVAVIINIIILFTIIPFIIVMVVVMSILIFIIFAPIPVVVAVVIIIIIAVTLWRTAKNAVRVLCSVSFAPTTCDFGGSCFRLADLRTT
ncbi:unnamed protein product [Dibothriocephalus latus]|uniref:Uncharacterized protein n=1 Tax=Dibothriocephalus latus TaxID=60516 RepID=A0A3P7PDJ3_DIBLA|nr:unnamed protein product [Dibothriocephalus latus]